MRGMSATPCMGFSVHARHMKDSISAIGTVNKNIFIYSGLCVNFARMAGKLPPM
jgi:hypothetical protein